jgi:phage terminase large subunit-like protein
MDHLDRAQRYMEGVAAGAIDSCEYIRLAVQRQLDDLAAGEVHWEYEDDAGDPVSLTYTFNEQRATAPCVFLEALPHIKGKWARQGLTISLQDWQCWAVTTLYGWIDQHGNRRFRVCYLEVPRKNAKSTIMAGLGLYHLSADDEPGAEVYSAATTRDQAKVSWSIAHSMAKRTPGLRSHLGVRTPAQSITAPGDAYFRPVSADSDTLDGLNPAAALIDELHAHKSSGVVDVLETGMGARSQPMQLEITTAGTNREGICYRHRDYTIRVLRGQVDDPTWWGAIYTIDATDDWKDSTAWRKANPNWGVSVDPVDFRRQANKAVDMASAMASFKTKRLNIWSQVDSAFFNMERWADCERQTAMDDWAAEPCILTLDLASKRDLAALVLSWYPVIDGRQHLVLQARGWVPEQALEEGPNKDIYTAWRDSGHLTVTPGNITDFDVIELDIKALAVQLNLLECAFDPFQATQLATHLAKAGVPMVELGATVRNFSEPMKELDAMTQKHHRKGKRVHAPVVIHDGNPVLDWCMSNVVAHVDRKDNVFPRKDADWKKIDAAVCAIMAMSRWLAPRKGDSVYKQRGLLVL